MAKTARPSPSLIPAILALLVLILFGYLLYTDLKPSRTEHTVNPPIEIIDSPPPLTVIKATPKPETNNSVTQKEATEFVNNLAEKPDTKKQAVVVKEGEDQFVRNDSTIVLPNLEHRDTTVQQLLNDRDLSADTPITLDYTEHKKITTTLADLDKNTQDHTVPLTITTANGRTITAPLADLLKSPELSVNDKITLHQDIKHSDKTTVGQLAKSGIAPSQQVMATINHGEQKLTIKEILKTGHLPDNALFYLHRVTEQDRQGLWGIIQAGLIEKFRAGLHIEGIAPNKETLRVTIPADADEKLPSGLSSFLGKILNNKVETSYVYNFTKHTMGHNPNLVYPGQQLILIHFSNEELKNIYVYFAHPRNHNVKTFAIGP